MSDGIGGFVLGATAGGALIFALWRLKGRPEVLRQVRAGIEAGERDVPEAIRPIGREVLRRISDTVVTALDNELP